MGTVAIANVIKAKNIRKDFTRVLVSLDGHEPVWRRVIDVEREYYASDRLRITFGEGASDWIDLNENTRVMVLPG
jgi:hypothetical protein